MAEMSPARKRLATAVVVIGTALIAEQVYSLATAPDSDVIAPVTKRAKPRTVAADAAPESVGAVRLDRLDARQQALAASAPGKTDRTPPLFESVAWQNAAQQAAAKAPPPPPPPKPVAPPFPYAYMGGLTDDAGRMGFFTKGERVLAVKAGDTVDAVFRVDQMTENQMQLTYLPLNQTLVVALGGAR
jgi:hypothetical protein